MTNGRTRLLVTIAACCAGVAATAALANDESSDPSGMPGGGIPKVDAIESAASQALSVLQTQRDTSDAMPAELSTRIGDHHAYGVNPALSRLASGSISNALYVLPARDHVCASLTVADGATLSCRETSKLAAGQVGAATVTLVGGYIGVYGLVPDGVESVTVNTGESTTTSAEVTRNGYFSVFSEGTQLRSVSYDGPSGSVEYPIYDPARVRTSSGATLGP